MKWCQRLLVVKYQRHNRYCTVGTLHLMRRMGKWSLGGETPFCLTHSLEPDRHGLAYFVTMLFLCRQCITGGYYDERRAAQHGRQSWTYGDTYLLIWKIRAPRSNYSCHRLDQVIDFFLEHQILATLYRVGQTRYYKKWTPLSNKDRQKLMAAFGDQF